MEMPASLLSDKQKEVFLRKFGTAGI